MKTRIVNPRVGVYAATDDYVHALDVRDVKRLLFVSGTMGLDQNGTTPDCLDEQLVLIWRNIGQILNSADMTTENIVKVTSYLTRADQAEANQNARIRALGTRRVPTTAIVVETLDPSWLVEVEVVAAG